MATWKLNDLTLKIDIGGQKLFAVLSFWDVLYFCFNLASVEGATQMLSRIRAKKAKTKDTFDGGGRKMLVEVNIDPG